MRSNLVLLGGVAAVVAGVFSFCVNALYSLLLTSVEVVPFMVPPLLTLAGIITTFLYALGLGGLYALLGGRSKLGITGLVLAFLTFLAALSPWIVGIFYALYQIIFLGRDTVRSSVVFFPQLAADLAGDALLAGAVLLLAVAALRVRALGRWTFVPFVVGFLSLVPLLIWAAYGLGLEAFGWLPLSPSLLRAPFWVLLGGVLWWRALRMERVAVGTHAGTRNGDPGPA